MTTKLTLNINKSTIESAKDYAKDNKTSLSQLIENYLESIVTKEKTKTTISPLVESLTGVIPSQSDKDHKNDYYEYLSKKYS
ncbi:MAG: DUF6364 family protein [Chitinophagaceae bacterium]